MADSFLFCGLWFCSRNLSKLRFKSFLVLIGLKATSDGDEVV